MQNSLEIAIEELRLALENDSRVILLKELEEKLYSIPEVIDLYKRKDEAENHYSDLLKIKDENDPEVLEARKALYEAKKNLDLQPDVMKYSEAFIVVRDLYMIIDDILFSPFRKKPILEGIK
ncbi:MAG: hypothetical protein K5694_05940 [Bacilli bacterium]|nr:hypothetical protein [Bacilli bacterium]